MCATTPPCTRSSAATWKRNPSVTAVSNVPPPALRYRTITLREDGSVTFRSPQAMRISTSPAARSTYQSARLDSAALPWRNRPRFTPRGGYVRPFRAMRQRFVVGKHRERPPRGWVASGRGRRVRRHPPVLAHEPVVLLRVLHVVPQTTPLRRDFQIDRHPGVLEPFVEPGEQHSPCRPRRAHLPREPCVDVGHRALVVPAVAHPVGLQMRHATRGGNAVLGDQEGSSRVMLLEGVQVAQVARPALG